MKMDMKALVANGKLMLKQHAPDILVGAGIVGMIGSAVMACVATRKLDGVLDVHKIRVAAVRKKFEADKEETTAEKRELTGAYAKTAISVIGLYGPSVALGGLSVTSILAGHDILRKRNVALAAAYATLDTGFRTYRSRVAERFGEEVDKELKLGLHQEKVDSVETDENGKGKKTKKAVPVVEGDTTGYARYFAYGEARAAEPNYDYNMFFLRGQQELANNMLRAQGYLFLNDVYEMLGIEKSIAGQVVGWVYDKNREDHGDNYVDFGIREVFRKKSDAPNDYEPVIMIDPNVDGPILDHAIDNGLIVR